MTKLRNDAYYAKHARDAFVDGFHVRKRSKRHFDTKYDRYHYYLPANLSPVLRFLKRYFEVLDRRSNVPPEHRFRQTHFEFAETAIQVFGMIRNRISVCDPLVLGSAEFSACPWAIVGPNIQKRLTKHHFVSPIEIISCYSRSMMMRGYNITAIDRPHHLQPEDDPLLRMATLYHCPVNAILSACLRFLFDVIRFAGPDCGELAFVFSNDKRKANRDYSAWREARASVIPPPQPDFGELWVRGGRKDVVGYNGQAHVPKTTFLPDLPIKQQLRHTNDIYFHVELDDVAGGITDGESYKWYIEIPSTKSPKPHFENFYQLSRDDLSDDDLTEEERELKRKFMDKEGSFDIIEEREIRKLDEEYQRIILG